MLKGSQALMAAIESGSPVPTNEAQRRELSAPSGCDAGECPTPAQLAAAPELLEALGNLIHHAERDIDEMDDLADCEEAEEEVRDARLALKLAYAAIAKAGGAK